MAASGRKEKNPLRAALLERELIDAIHRCSLQDIEEIPEMRHLIQHVLATQVERARIAESLDTLPTADVQKLFADYVEERYDVHLHTFFGRLYDGVMGMLRSTLSARMEILEESMQDLKRSVLMSALHPYAWVESEVVREVCEWLQTQPGGKGGLHAMYQHVAFEAKTPLPGASLVDKYHYLLRVVRATDRIREIDGMLFELTDYKMLEERDVLATADGHREAAQLLAHMQDVENRL